MNWVAISAIGDILAAEGVIGSLVFVGLQIRRNRQATVPERPGWRDGFEHLGAYKTQFGTGLLMCKKL